MTIDDIGSIKGLLADMDGVWFVGDHPLPGAIEAFTRFRKRGIPIRFVTNTTTKTREQMASTMLSMGFDVEPAEFVTTPARGRVAPARGRHRAREAGHLAVDSGRVRRHCRLALRTKPSSSATSGARGTTTS